MSPREKQQLYHGLAQLIHAGITFPKALDRLSKTSRGSAAQVIRRIRRGLDQGLTVADACAEARPTITSMEAAILVAVERAGSLDRGLAQLAQHFDAVSAARGKAIARLAYPVFVLVLAILLLNLPLVVRENFNAYLQRISTLLAGVIAAVFLAKFARDLIASATISSPFVERLVRLIPAVGSMQRAFAMNRFCLVYDLQIEAGINTLDALQAAAEASRSALVANLIRKILPEVRAGSQVGPLLVGSDAFDPAVVECILVGEESGRLDQELQRQAKLQEEKAFSRLNTLAEWIPRLAYLAIMISVGVAIVRLYAGYLGQVQSVIDGIAP